MTQIEIAHSEFRSTIKADMKQKFFDSKISASQTGGVSGADYDSNHLNSTVQNQNHDYSFQMDSAPISIFQYDGKEASINSKLSRSSVFRGAFDISKHEHLSLIKLK